MLISRSLYYSTCQGTRRLLLALSTAEAYLEHDLGFKKIVVKAQTTSPLLIPIKIAYYIRYSRSLLIGSNRAK